MPALRPMFGSPATASFFRIHNGMACVVRNKEKILYVLWLRIKTKFPKKNAARRAGNPTGKQLAAKTV